MRFEYINQPIATQGANMDESKQEQEQNMSWLSRAVGVSYSVSWDEIDPVKTICDFAKEAALEASRRAASGYALSLSGENYKERSWLYENEMASLAKQLVIVSAQNGTLPTGQRLGAFKALLAQAPWPAKSVALQVNSSLVAMSPEWAKAVEQVANGQAVGSNEPEVSTEAPKYLGGFVGFEKDYVKALADARLKASHAALSELDREMQPAIGAGRADRMSQASGQARMTLSAIRELRVAASAREFDTGADWSVSGSHAFQLMRDDHLASMGRSLVSLVDRSGLDPRVDPEVIAGVSTLASMMSPLAGNNFLKELGQATKDRVIHSGWNQSIKRAQSMHGEQWKIGVAQPAKAPTTGFFGVAMDVSPPIDIDLGWFKPGGEVQDQEARLLQKAKAADTGFKAGFMVGSAIKRFVESFDRSVVSAQNTVGTIAQANPKQWAASLIIKGNEITDRAESAIKDKWSSTRGQAVDAVMSAAQVGVHAVSSVRDAAVGKIAEGREAFVGKVGELRQATLASVGSMVLKAADTISGEKKKNPEEVARQIKIVKAASIGGLLFVGVCLGSTGVVVAATLGALGVGALAVVGAKVAIKAGTESFKEMSARLPGALEDLAERLGAKRAIKVQVPEITNQSVPGLKV